MAAASGDAVMMAVLNSGGDLHSEAAAGMFGIDPKDARQKKPGSDKSYRDYGKILMFSLAFGKTAAGFAEDWGISEDEAKGYIKGFETRFPKLAKFLTDAGKYAEQSNFSRLLNGAVRYVGGGEGQSGKGAANRAGKNFKIQGLASFMTRIAMISLDELAMKGKIENKWAREALPIYNEWAERTGSPLFDLDADLAPGIVPDPLTGVLPLQMVGTIHDELLNHFQASDDYPWTLQRQGNHEAWNSANARVKAADKAKDKDAEALAKADLKVIEAELNEACATTCPDHYVPGRECVLFFEKVIGMAMTLAGVYYLRGKVPAGFSTATGLVWQH